jgi:hypothetical protein
MPAAVRRERGCGRREGRHRPRDLGRLLVAGPAPHRAEDTVGQDVDALGGAVAGAGA